MIEDLFCRDSRQSAVGSRQSAVGSNKNVDLAIYSKRKQLLELFYLIFLRGLFANLPVLCVKPLLFLTKIAMKKITQRICKDISGCKIFSAYANYTALDGLQRYNRSVTQSVG